ncbi:MAG: sigma-70 family RNA polymerase sigma factor [Thermoanaerobaculia bacterium]
MALTYLEEITSFAKRLTGNVADADDLVQATFERAFRAWRDLRDPAACRAWLFRIARNLFVDGRRAAGVRSQLSLASDTETQAEAFVVPMEAVERLTARELEAALARLPREQREALLLCDLWGFQYTEIAEIVGSPTGTVRSRIARARGRLSALLGRTAKGSKESSKP